jgi:bifunctional DNA-binding transcriptional regulator/antitoxin component of YhaV-PrlF toxin-antitoxin module
MPESLARSLGTIRVGEKGEITVPAIYRKKHKLSKGSEVLLLQLGAALMMVPVDPTLDRLCRRIQENLAKGDISLEQAQKNLGRVRRRRFQQLYGKKSLLSEILS